MALTSRHLTSNSWTAIWALACTRPGFPNVNCHLRVDELRAWVD